MAAGQADCVMGSSDLQMMQVREGGVPVVTVAALFQKDPQVLIAHDDVKNFEDMKAQDHPDRLRRNRGYWPWLKAKYGFTDAADAALHLQHPALRRRQEHRRSRAT